MSNCDIAEDAQHQLFGRLRDKLFLIQLHEAIRCNFIACIRFYDGTAAVEELKSKNFQNLGAVHSVLLFYYYTEWLSRGKFLQRIYELKHEITIND